MTNIWLMLIFWLVLLLFLEVKGLLRELKSWRAEWHEANRKLLKRGTYWEPFSIKKEE